MNEKKIRLEEGNLVLLDVEAVVNAANKNLVLGGGVAGAIRHFGGPTIQEECDIKAPIKTGEAVITGGGKLKAKYVIHAVGPIYGEGNEDEKLASATQNSLRIAREKKIKTIAFPAVSTGIFGFPLKRCSQIMIQEAMDFVKDRNNEYPEEIIFCLYGQESFSIFQQILDELSHVNETE